MRKYTFTLLLFIGSLHGFTYPFYPPKSGQKLRWTLLTTFFVQQVVNFGHAYDVDIEIGHNNKDSIIMKTTNKFKITLDFESMVEKRSQGKVDLITDSPRIPSNIFSLIYGCYQIIVHNPDKERDPIRVALYEQIYDHA